MSVDAVGGLQRRIGHALRSKIAGDDAASKAQQIWGAQGERWFVPGDPIWRVHADASMFPGGIASLLLQSLHPLAMAGVAGHSGYKSDPWGRLQRTSTYIATTTYGTVTDAEAVIDKVRAIHERVRGTAPDGRPYRASDPHLLGWVHAAEIACFLRAYQTFGDTPLTASEADDYVAQTGLVASRIGVLDPPQTVQELLRGLDRYRPELESSDAAKEAARFLLLEPPLPLAARPGYATLGSGAVALLPAWARSMLGLPVSRLLMSAVARPLGHAGTATVRWAMAGVRERRPADGPE